MKQEEDKNENIKNKAINLYNALVENESSGCELKLTKGYHMTVTISRTVEFPEFEYIFEHIK